MYELRDVARFMGFLSIGPMAILDGDDCAVITNDPHKTLKIHARGLVINGDELISYMPTGIVGFEALLSSKETLAIGLCEYPEYVPTRSGGRICTERAGRASWMSFVRTIRRQDCDGCQECIDSHHSAIALLRAAEKMGIVRHVQDPFGYWKSRDEIALRSAMVAAELCH